MSLARSHSDAAAARSTAPFTSMHCALKAGKNSHSWRIN